MMRLAIGAVVLFAVVLKVEPALADSAVEHSENVGAIWIPREVPRVPFRDLFSMKKTGAPEKKPAADAAPSTKRDG